MSYDLFGTLFNADCQIEFLRSNRTTSIEIPQNVYYDSFFSTLQTEM